MGNISWRSQGSSEDTDSSLQGDQDEDSGTDTYSLDAWWTFGGFNADVSFFFQLVLTLAHCCRLKGVGALEKQDCWRLFAFHLSCLICHDNDEVNWTF